jgi:hypothetical protein
MNEGFVLGSRSLLPGFFDSACRTSKPSEFRISFMTFIPYYFLETKVTLSYRRQNFKVVAATTPQNAV